MNYHHHYYTHTRYCALRTAILRYSYCEYNLKACTRGAPPPPPPPPHLPLYERRLRYEIQFMSVDMRVTYCLNSLLDASALLCWNGLVYRWKRFFERYMALGESTPRACSSRTTRLNCAIAMSSERAISPCLLSPRSVLSPRESGLKTVVTIMPRWGEKVDISPPRPVALQMSERSSI